MFRQEMKPLVAPLADLGEQAKIVFITPESPIRHRLDPLGVVTWSSFTRRGRLM